jgi:hypothetical protein
MADEEIAARFAINADGSVANPQPLQDRGYVYTATNHSWRRTAARSQIKFTKAVSRAAIASECKISEALLQAWEEAIASRDRRAHDETSAKLAVTATGQPLCHNPLEHLNLAYFPRSGVWRRTRADRSEVSREVVAKRARVTCEVLLSWEQAVRAATNKPSDAGNGPA